MSYKWYVVHVYSGSEKRVKETIEEQILVEENLEILPDSFYIVSHLVDVRIAESQPWYKDGYVTQMKETYQDLVDRVKESCVYANNSEFRFEFDTYVDFNHDFVGFGGERDITDGLEKMFWDYGVIYA